MNLLQTLILPRIKQAKELWVANPTACAEDSINDMSNLELLEEISAALEVLLNGKEDVK